MASAFETVADFLVEDRRTVDGLSVEDQRLATVGCLLVVGPEGPELAATLREAIREGSAPKRLEAMLVHAIGYLGVVVPRRAYEQLRRALAEAGQATALDGAIPIPADRAARVEQGARLYDRFDPGRRAQQAAGFVPLSPIYYPRAMELSGLVLADGTLVARDRQIMTVAMLASLGGQSDQLRFHIGVALGSGISRETLAAVLIIVQAYAGMPRANGAASLALEMLADDSAS
ncbi:MAG TPA: carboxymuconolactone decarboxylase family protein [Aliidongia sp.]|uniref:carboxymuconolactone decarboxylase family protein n=1 Tax=Aliidongia sp. TaxID=1914230 RepID=UPI002DDD6425|nr:carboxymuconolactone decarboxylase family protein [Aliidongia sp.]HEV2676441.1 carboxymuconolactone decarboxylase family protein [Aliidongia sp.]